jgi:hypothetical protein
VKKFKEIRKIISEKADDYVTDDDDYPDGEEEFVDLHTIELIGHPVANDDQFQSDFETNSHTGAADDAVAGEKEIVKQTNSGDLKFAKFREKVAKVDKTNKKTVKEEIELIDETLKVGAIKLKSGESVNLSAQDLKAINEVMSDLNPENKKRMETELLKDKASFNKMVTFAKEAQ